VIQEKASQFFAEQQRVSDMIEGLETTESKLRYELRVLSEKLSEVEEVLHNFHYKVYPLNANESFMLTLTRSVILKIKFSCPVMEDGWSQEVHI
jgi:dsDNA-specific endonuclease/ATPase MutS2